MRRRRTKDPVLLALLEESGANVRRTAELLRELIHDYPEQAGLAADVLACEHAGDRITHDIIHRLNGDRPRGTAAPFSASDGLVLATALDDIVDLAEQTADTLGTYHVEAPMEQATALADVLVLAAVQVEQAIAGFAAGTDMRDALVEIHRLENEGDRVSRDAVASLFADGIDPMVVIRWKDIFESLEASVDACETVAHTLEGIALKRGSR